MVGPLLWSIVMPLPFKGILKLPDGARFPSKKSFLEGSYGEHNDQIDRCCVLLWPSQPQPRQCRPSRFISRTAWSRKSVRTVARGCAGITHSVAARLHPPAAMSAEEWSQATDKPKKPDRALALSGFKLLCNPVLTP